MSLIERVCRTASHRYDDKCGSAHSIKIPFSVVLLTKKLGLLAQIFVTNSDALAEHRYADGALVHSYILLANQGSRFARQEALS
jgi:hypothetical protein